MTEVQGLRGGVAVVGGGYWGRNLIRVFSELGRLAAVVGAGMSPQLTSMPRHTALRCTLPRAGSCVQGSLQ